MRTIGAVLLLILLLTPCRSGGQTNAHFDISLRVDYSSVDEVLDFFDRKANNSARVAKQQGNQIAAGTSLLLARTERPGDDFVRALELARDSYKSTNDIYGLKMTLSRLDELKKLLAETKSRRLDRRVVATISSLFPSDASVSLTIPVFVVAMGNENAAAFVRRVAWKDDTPVFVGDDQGEQVIVLNLARCLIRGGDVQQEFVQVLSTLAHECFHAVYAAYRSDFSEDTLPKTPFFALAHLVQNEGIAYFLSREIRDGGEVPPSQWFDATRRAVERLNSAFLELQSPELTSFRARELMMNSNLSGSFEGNYGATAGLRIAYEIENRLGRPALTETVREGVRSFFERYRELCRRDSNLPRFDDSVLRAIAH
ncbi:MAG: DUF5700 domain-containing putative Zn-dependent protease [Ignavibacteria bacterium]|nr:DUF5700 domain-containing putative Zn-dependent protease [Ignavibacteria bacterium]